MKALILTLMLTASFVYAQSREIEDYLLGPAQDFYGYNYLNGPNAGRGNTGVAGENDISGALMNPAAYTLNKKYAFNLQYTYKTTNEVSYTYEMGPSFRYDLKHVAPALQGGFAMKLTKKLIAGILYSNPSSVKYVFKNAGAFQSDYNMTESVNMHSVNIPIVYDFGRIQLGLNPNYTFAKGLITGVTTITEPDGYGEVSTHYNRFNVQLGLRILPVKGVSIGVTFTPAYTAEVKSDDELVPSGYSIVTKSPMKISAGFEYACEKKTFRISADYNFSQTSKLNGYKDKHDFNIGGEYSVNKRLALRAGFFTVFDVRNFEDDDVSFPGKAGDFTQYFVTCGVSYKLNNFDFSASLLDSHVSMGLIKLTIINAGFTYGF